MAAPGSLAGSGAGLPGVGQFRLDMAVPSFNDGYHGLQETTHRPPPDAPYRVRRAPSQSPHGASHAGAGQFGILAPTTMPTGVLDASPHVSFALDHVQPAEKTHGRIVVDPPDLQAWREKLFNVDDMIVLTDEQHVSSCSLSPRLVAG